MLLISVFYQQQFIWLNGERLSASLWDEAFVSGQLLNFKRVKRRHVIGEVSEKKVKKVTAAVMKRNETTRSTGPSSSQHVEIFNCHLPFLHVTAAAVGSAFKSPAL